MSSRSAGKELREAPQRPDQDRRHLLQLMCWAPEEPAGRRGATTSDLEALPESLIDQPDPDWVMKTLCQEVPAWGSPWSKQGEAQILAKLDQEESND